MPLRRTTSVMTLGTLKGRAIGIYRISDHYFGFGGGFLCFQILELRKLANP